MIDLDAIRARADAATPGPWYAINDDDDMFMNVNFVSTQQGLWFDNTPESYEHIIALVLLQSPRLACHKAARWDEDMEFIAHAREDIPDLLDALTAANARIRQLEDALADILDREIDGDDDDLVYVPVGTMRRAAAVLQASAQEEGT